MQLETVEVGLRRQTGLLGLPSGRAPGQLGVCAAAGRGAGQMHRPGHRLRHPASLVDEVCKPLLRIGIGAVLLDLPGPFERRRTVSTNH